MNGLSLENIEAGYRGRPVIPGFTLAPILAGQVVSLVGPNAAGKSTLLRAIAGVAPAQGEVRLDGERMTALSLSERSRRIAYMPQTLPEGVSLSVLEGVISALRAAPGLDGVLGRDAAAERAVAILERVGIADLALRGLDQLSGGQRQLAALAQAIAREPRVLLLDEPTSALDMHHAFRVFRLARSLAAERGTMVVMAVHDLQAAARVSDRVVVISKGMLAADGPPEQAVTAAMLAEVYQVRARVSTDVHGALQIAVDDTL